MAITNFPKDHENLNSTIIHINDEIRPKLQKRGKKCFLCSLSTVREENFFQKINHQFRIDSKCVIRIVNIIYCTNTASKSNKRGHKYEKNSSSKRCTLWKN